MNSGGNWPMPSGVPIISSDDGHYALLNYLGEGSFGTVLMCQNLQTKEDVAIKIVDLAMVDNTQDEVCMLDYINKFDTDRYNFVKFFDQFEYGGFTCLVFEMLDCDLYDLMRERHGIPLSPAEIRPIAQQMFVALGMLGNLGILHTDIKPNNIMLVNRWDQPLRVKLIDFGLAIPTNCTSLGMKLQPTGFRAPEVSLGLPITPAIDLWGLGCTLGYLFLGEHLFSTSSMFQMMGCMVQVLGQPDDELLDRALYGHHFFKVVSRQQGLTWELMTSEEYHAINFGTMETMASYKMCNTLENVATMNPYDGFAIKMDGLMFVHLLRRLLDFDVDLRISAPGALKHCFVTMDHLEKLSCQPYLEESQRIMDLCRHGQRVRPPTRRISNKPSHPIWNWKLYSSL
ncbi:homeodomain-interacting protein kinase 1-like [Nelusetta ayraudi]|uniref:homeodomain-interacting protein kinase 1-like n=1 Tax=Nelusetta ayraudi TaxID=303726 RepID=UPI003F6F0343